MKTTSCLWNVGNLLGCGKSLRSLGRLATLTAVLCLAGGTALAADYCSQTTKAAFTACQYDAHANYWIALGICANETGPAVQSKSKGCGWTGQSECARSAKATFKEEYATCGEQRQARREICRVLGGAPYDPDIDPAMFVDPALIGASITANPYLPLLRGRTWVYKVGTETTTVIVTDETREILGVTCAVIHDVVKDNGVVIEDTKDWYAQDTDGNVWYFGEISQGFDDGELVSIEGSWTAGRESAKPGIIMYKYPAVGQLYRQEFALGEAEDMAQVLSLNGSATVPVASASCSGDCLITKDFSALEPGVAEHKYFKPGVGQILTINVETGDREELVGFTP
jgi:hypothetical protein